MTATPATPRTGFAIPCPLCGALEGLRVVAHNLTLECAECTEPIDRAELVRLADDVARLLRWIDTATE